MRSIFAFLCFLLLTGAVSNEASAQLLCTNQTDKDVWITVAYNYIGAEATSFKDNTWVTEGWKRIAPNDTAMLSKHIGYDKKMGSKTNFFFYAYQPNGREWKGIRKFAVNTLPPSTETADEFDWRITRAHKEIMVDPRRNPNNKRFLFKAGILADTQESGKTLEVITLRSTDINDEPEKKSQIVVPATGGQ